MRRFTGILILLAALVGPGALAQTPAPSPQPEVSRYAQLPFLSDAQLSPNGQLIAARLSAGGEEHIVIWTIADGPDQRPLTVRVAGIESFMWAGDDRLLIHQLRLAVRAESSAIYVGPQRRVIKLDLASRRLSLLGESEGVYDEVIFLDPHGRYVLLASQASILGTPGVVHVDLATNASTLIERPRRGVWSWHADANGIVRVGIDYDDNRTRIFYREGPGQPLRLIETRRNLADQSVIDQVRFISDTSRGIIVTNAATGRFGVYEYDFATDTRGAALFEHPEADVTEAIFGEGGTLEGVRYDDERPRIRWFDTRLADMQALIDRTLRDKTNTIVSRSRDGSRALVFSSAADDPGTYYVFDRAARRMEAFASPYDMLADLPHAPVRPITYRSRDGLTIRGYLTLPRGRPERGLPLIVLPHGGPFLRDTWTFDPEVQFLASQGYAVLQANFRGSTGYGRDFVARGFGQLGAGMIDDLEDGIDWLAGQGTIDPARVCIMGSSYGGYAASWAAIRSPQRYRCAISWAGPSDLRTMLRHTAKGFSARRYFREYRQQVEGTPAIDLDAVSPARQAARLRVPLLIGHGRNDSVVPPEQSERLVGALTRARAANVESVFYPKSAHAFTEVTEREDFLRRVAAFLARHNPAGEPAPTAQ